MKHEAIDLTHDSRDNDFLQSLQANFSSVAPLIPDDHQDDGIPWWPNHVHNINRYMTSFTTEQDKADLFARDSRFVPQ